MPEGGEPISTYLPLKFIVVTSHLRNANIYKFMFVAQIHTHFTYTM
jgi:hypothetical protein